jgi:hypothetical protein
VYAISSVVPSSCPAHNPIRSSAGTMNTSRLATPWTVQATAWWTFTRNFNLTPTQTTGLAVPHPRTLPAAEVHLAHDHPPTIPKAFGTATQLAQIPNTPSAKTETPIIYNSRHTYTHPYVAYHLISPGDGLLRPTMHWRGVLGFTSISATSIHGYGFSRHRTPASRRMHQGPHSYFSWILS